MSHSQCRFQAARLTSLAVLACLLWLTSGISVRAEVAAGSDLFKELQTQNAKLQQQQQEAATRLQAKEQEALGLQKQLEALAAARKAAELDTQQALAREANLKQRLADSEARGDEAVATLKELRGLLASQAEAVGAQKEHIGQIEGEKETLRGDAQKAQGAEAAARAEADRIKTEWEQTAAGIRQERATLHFNMAVLYDKRSRYSDAEREYQRCLESNPQDRDAHYNLGILYQDKLRMPGKAKEHYEAFLILVPDGPDAERVKGWVAALNEKTN